MRRLIALLVALSPSRTPRGGVALSCAGVRGQCCRWEMTLVLLVFDFFRLVAAVDFEAAAGEHGVAAEFFARLGDRGFGSGALRGFYPACRLCRPSAASLKSERPTPIRRYLVRPSASPATIRARARRCARPAASARAAGGGG